MGTRSNTSIWQCLVSRYGKWNDARWAWFFTIRIFRCFWFIPRIFSSLVSYTRISPVSRSSYVTIYTITRRCFIPIIFSIFSICTFKSINISYISILQPYWWKYKSCKSRILSNQS